MGKPALLLSDEIVILLEDYALYKITFSELSGTEHPWEVDFNLFKKIRGHIYQIENGIRNSYPDREITCVIAGRGMFWLPQQGLENYKEEIDKQVTRLKKEGPMPVWQLTTAEMFGNHINNIRQLIMAAAHDLILLNNLKESLGGSHDFLQREFENCELRVRGLLDNFKDQGDHLSFAMSNYVSLAERCRITQEMLERGETSPEQLGYDLETLNRVIAVLDKKLRDRIPTYQRRILAISNKIKESLRGGETTQLVRISRWDMAYSMMGTPPVGYKGQALIAESEREGLDVVVSSRESELGESEEGKHALNISQEAQETTPETEPPAVPEEPAEEPKPESKTQEKKKPRGMAYLDRRR